MDETDRFFIWLSVAVYGIAAVAGISYLVGRRTRSVTFPIIAVGFILQSTGLYLRGMEIGACPLGNNFEIVQFIAWSTMFLFLVVGPVFHLKLLGSATATLVCIAGVVSLTVPGWDEPHAAALFGGDPLIEFHAAVSIFSYGIFGLLSTVSILYLIQYRALEKKWRSRIFTLLPSIVKLDNLAKRLLSAGVLVLSLAFLSGIMVWFEEAWSVLHWKILTVFVLWLGYGGIWFLRLRQRFSPHRAAICFLTLYLFALFSLWPVNQAHEANPAQSPPPQTDSATVEDR